MIIGLDGWEIINRHDTWIYAQEFNMGGPSKSGRHLELVDARGVVKNSLNGKHYFLILRKYFFNPNSEETLLAENQIECYSVKVYYCPRVFGGKKLAEAKYQMGRSVKLVISWNGSTRYLDVSPPTREDV